MTTSVTWNNTVRSVPAAGELNWSSLTSLLVDLGQNAQTTNFQKVGMRVATTSPVTVAAASDCVVVTTLAAPGAVAVTLPAGVTGQMFCIIDGTGDAATNAVTITPTAGNINGAATYVLSSNREGVIFIYNGTEWSVLAEFKAAGTITNADISATAAIAYSKLALTGSIVNADISAAAVIAHNKMAALTVSRAMVSDGSGVASVATTTATEIGYVNGVTSAIQTQIDSKSTKTLTDAYVFVGNVSNVATGVAISGDIGITNAGVVSITSDSIINADIKSDAAIADTKLATISTALKVSNSATTAASANTASAIVARDGSGNFSAGTITAALSGNVTGNVTGDVTGNVSGTAASVTGVTPADHGGTGVANNAAATTTRTGNYAKTETLTGITSVTYPTTGTLATLGGAETFTGVKTLDEALGIKQVATPSNPSAGYNKIYAKTDGLLYKLDSAGNEVLVGSGAGSGEINIAINPNGDTALDGSRTDDVGDWIDSGTGTTSSRTTTAADIPLYPTKTNAIKILNDGSGTDYTRMRMTLPQSLYNRKLKLAWEQFVSTSTAYASSDFKVEVYSNASSDYSGAYTAISTTSESSSVTSIPAATGKFQTSFHPAATPYLEVRFTRVAGTANSYITLNDFVVGPGIQPQGAVVGEWTSYTPDAGVNLGFGTITSPVFTYQRVGSSIAISGTFTTGTVVASEARIALPTGLTFGTVSSTAVVGKWTRQFATGSAFKQGTLLATTGQAYLKFSVDDYTATLNPITPQNGNGIVSNTQGVSLTTVLIPIAEWAGSGVNLAQNDVEYAASAGTWDAADTTTAYGPNGQAINSTLAATRDKTITWQTPVQITDRIQIWFSKDRLSWYPGGEVGLGSNNIPVITHFDTGGSIIAGVQVISSTSTTTQLRFRRYQAIGNDDTPLVDWPTSDAYWVATKAKSGQAVSFGAATATSSGLVRGGTVPGQVSGATIAAGYVGEYLTANGSATAWSHTVAQEGGNAGITLTPGVWSVWMKVTHVVGGDTAITSYQYGVGTATGNNFTGGTNVTLDFRASHTPPGNSTFNSAIQYANVSSSTPYYPKIQVNGTRSAGTVNCTIYAIRIA